MPSKIILVSPVDYKTYSYYINLQFFLYDADLEEGVGFVVTITMLVHFGVV